MAFHFSQIRLPVPHIQQRADGECLVACTAMVFDYLGLPFDYQRGMRLLRIRAQIGTPFYQIRELSKLGISVVYQQGTLPDLHVYLTQGLPCIVGVKTGELSYWQGVNVQHAVVVIGLENDFVYLNDPAFSNGPVRVALGDLISLGWNRMRFLLS